MAKLIFLMMIISITESAGAILDLYVQEDLPVYEKPRQGARQVSRLARGDRVVISPKTYGAYRKVLVTYGSKRGGGYIRISHMHKSYIKDRRKERLKGKRIYKEKYSLGFSVVGSYMRQGSRTFRASSADEYEISVLTSKTFFFTLFSDIPLSPTLMLQPSLGFRSGRFKGEAGLKGAVNALKPAQVTLEQKLVSLGLMAKSYGSPHHSFWYGGGVELGNGLSSKLVINDNGLPIEEESDKFFSFLLYGAAGWDLPVVGPFWLSPHFRLGLVPNKSLITLYVEAYVSLAYSFL